MVAVLGNPQCSTDAFDPGAFGVVETDDLMCFETKLGAIKTEVNVRSFSD